MANELKVKVTTDDPGFTKLSNQGFSNALFSNTIGALNAIMSAYEMTWVAYAQGNMTVPGAPPIYSKGPYARSIQSADIGPFEKEVFTDYFPHTYIETGHGEIDLKPGLLRGKSARMGKDGPYAIVSFRHYTRNDFIEQRKDMVNKTGGNVPMRKGVMPSSIQSAIRGETDRADRAKAMGMSDRGGRSTQLTAGAKPEQRSYNWGSRLDSQLQTGRRSQLYKRGNPEKNAPKGAGYTWKSGKYAGLVRMNTPSGPTENRSQYRTFRVVSHRSDPRSWIVPPRPPIPIRQATIDFVEAHMHVENMIAKNLEKDLS